jgi:hypothetical protein
MVPRALATRLERNFIWNKKSEMTDGSSDVLTGSAGIWLDASHPTEK